MSKYRGEWGEKTPESVGTKPPENVGPSSDLSKATAEFSKIAQRMEVKQNWLKKLAQFVGIDTDKLDKSNIVRYYGEMLDKFTKDEENSGTPALEALAKWHILQGPERAGSILGGYGIDCESFVKARDSWVQAFGDEISQTVINNWAEVQEAAFSKLRRAKKFFLESGIIENFVKECDKWINAGVLSMEDIEIIFPEIQTTKKSIIDLIMNNTQNINSDRGFVIVPRKADQISQIIRKLSGKK